MGAAEVFQEALRARDDDARWEQVTWLHAHGGAEALAIAEQLGRDPDPVRRTLAADVLGQLGARPGRPAKDGPFREQALAALLSMVEADDDPDVLAAIAVGFGHIGDGRSVAPLVRLSRFPDAEVRSGATFGLLGRPEEDALRALAALTGDESAPVRDGE